MARTARTVKELPGAKQAREFSFTGKIGKAGINPCVAVPLAGSLHFGKRGYVRIVATVNSHRCTTTLVPVGGGRHRLYLNQEIRDAAHVDVGDIVSLTVKLDGSTRRMNIPADFSRALDTAADARSAFDQEPASHKREILRWIEHAKRQNTRQRRIGKAIAAMVTKRKNRVDS
jgi:hypothetical protein